MKVMRPLWSLRALVVLLIVALATSGFAHRFATPEQQAALTFAQSYGLDISAICGDFEDADSTQTCEACRLHAAASLPEPAVALILAELSCDPADWVPQPPVLNALTAEAARPARAPPTV
ncbi:polyketide synthase [Phaeobacter sp. CAU 1743]|uniref:polyketide synthase n=1 Tax=Phaeobacter sp. CAU 1743 TaxID=3140367 RepID=UPI00325ADA4B